MFFEGFKGVCLSYLELENQSLSTEWKELKLNGFCNEDESKYKRFASRIMSSYMV